VILEIKASGMCGSDLHNYRAPANPGGAVTGGIKREAGMIAGHEPCGVVAAVGAGVTEKEARVGQRVMDHHYDGCGNCKHCRAAGRRCASRARWSTARAATAAMRNT
jgi:threonine dehydrogenase-like Zn-dependent dehydrogenase